MVDSPLNMFRMASERFLEQTRSDFGQRLAADFLEPMSRELQELTNDLEYTMDKIANLEAQLADCRK